MFNILFIGDIVGRAGRRAIRKLLPEVKENNDLDLIIANGENAAGGFGITRKVADELYSYGIDCITMGNHTWRNKDIFNFIEEENRIIRPLNYFPGVPGKGWTIIEKEDIKIGVVNLIGQSFIGNYNSPFIVFRNHFQGLKDVTDLIVIDFHGEATGEKLAFAHYFSGEVTCIVGTHTHIQTADARVLPGETGYITDLGLTGAVDSILGMKKDKVIEKYLTLLPKRFEAATGQCQLNGAIMSVDPEQGKCSSVKAIQLTD